jgi:hypothetical protein
MEDYAYMKEKAIDRLGRDWDTDRGWGERMPKGFYYRLVRVSVAFCFHVVTLIQSL